MDMELVKNYVEKLSELSKLLSRGDDNSVRYDNTIDEIDSYWLRMDETEKSAAAEASKTLKLERSRHNDFKRRDRSIVVLKLS